LRSGTPPRLRLGHAWQNTRPWLKTAPDSRLRSCRQRRRLQAADRLRSNPAENRDRSSDRPGASSYIHHPRLRKSGTPTPGTIAETIATVAAEGKRNALQRSRSRMDLVFGNHNRTFWQGQVKAIPADACQCAPGSTMHNGCMIATSVWSRWPVGACCSELEESCGVVA
jgi:hypothetical protein